MPSWERRNRKTLLDSPFMSVWQDTVELPDGQLIEDYSVAKLPDGITIVATDENDKAILFEEYKYATNETILTFPGGGIDGDETPLEAAARELLEETGYESSELELLGKFNLYPSKIQQVSCIVRARNARKITEAEHEATEAIGEIQLFTVEELREIRQMGKLSTATLFAALALAFPETLRD